MYYFFGWETFAWFVVVFPFIAYTVFLLYFALYALENKALEKEAQQPKVADSFYSNSL
jgi:large-conductance mechanosensitive channel